MSLSVHSETAPLREVLLHRPGSELEQLTPTHLGRMLFDDIPFLTGAQREHDAFADTLRAHGVKVRYLLDLAAQTLHQSDDLRLRFIDDYIAAAGPAATYYAQPLRELLGSIKDCHQLVEHTMRGITDRDLGLGPRRPLVQAIAGNEPGFITDPVPNLYFCRDPFSVVGHSVVLSRMHAPARQRETLYGRYILQHHPDYAGKVPLYYGPSFPFSLEGGDLLTLSGRLLCVGLSQRTSPEAVELLAHTLFGEESCGIREVLAISIPNIRAYMHLDTVFTQVDKAIFTVHPGILDVLKMWRIIPGAAGQLQVQEQAGKLQDVLARAMGLDKVTLIRGGGSDSIAAQREQWNDGSNTLCVRPGTVIVYDRNTITNKILTEHGVRTIEIPGSELGRGRGGPRCMSMPLRREQQ